MKIIIMVVVREGQFGKDVPGLGGHTSLKTVQSVRYNVISSRPVTHVDLKLREILGGPNQA